MILKVNDEQHHSHVYDYFRRVFLETMRESIIEFRIRPARNNVGYNDDYLMYNEHAALKEINKCYIDTQKRISCKTRDLSFDEATSASNCWSVYSAHHRRGNYIDLLFIHRMKRQHSFSCDSLCIAVNKELLREIDSIVSKTSENNAVLAMSRFSYNDNSSNNSLNNNITSYNINIPNPNIISSVNQNYAIDNINWQAGAKTECKRVNMSPITAFSLFGNFKLCLNDLVNRRIRVSNPEQIHRARGFLKYCDLLSSRWISVFESKPNLMLELELFLFIRFSTDLDLTIECKMKHTTESKWKELNSHSNNNSPLDDMSDENDDPNGSEQKYDYVPLNGRYIIDDPTIGTYARRHFMHHPLRKIRFIEMVGFILNRVYQFMHQRVNVDEMYVVIHLVGLNEQVIIDEWLMYWWNSRNYSQSIETDREKIISGDYKDQNKLLAKLEHFYYRQRTLFDGYMFGKYLGYFEMLIKHLSMKEQSSSTKSNPNPKSNSKSTQFCLAISNTRK